MGGKGAAREAAAPAELSVFYAFPVLKKKQTHVHTHTPFVNISEFT
jgi:hypothetical protein